MKCGSTLAAARSPPSGFVAAAFQRLRCTAGSTMRIRSMHLLGRCRNSKSSRWILRVTGIRTRARMMSAIGAGSITGRHCGGRPAGLAAFRHRCAFDGCRIQHATRWPVSRTRVRTDMYRRLGGGDHGRYRARWRAREPRHVSDVFGHHVARVRIARCDGGTARDAKDIEFAAARALVSAATDARTRATSGRPNHASAVPIPSASLTTWSWHSRGVPTRLR